MGQELWCPVRLALSLVREDVLATMSPQKSIFLCTFIARYCAIYRSSVIFLSGGTWINDRAAFCSHEDFSPAAAVLVLSNLTVVFDHVAKKFVLRQHFLVVVPAHQFANAEDWSKLERYTPRSGFSRWLLLQESSLNDQKSKNYLLSGLMNIGSEDDTSVRG